MVDPELFAGYQAALGTNADLARHAVEDLLAKLDGLAPLERAEYLMANYPKLVRAYGKVAADVARQFYQESRDAHFEDDPDASEYAAQSAQQIQERWAAEDVAQVAQEGLGHLPKVAVRRAMQRADQTLAYNVRRDPARGRWAIVPHAGACGWCVMVASNGWAYSERSVNAQRHDGCKCSVAVDFDTDNPLLEGYDPKAMQDAYARAEETVHDDVERRWAAMTADEQARYRRKGRSAKDVFKTLQVTKEMDRRDRGWLQDGKPVAIDYAEKPRGMYGALIDAKLPLQERYLLNNISGRDNERKDLFAHDMLSAVGFKVRSRLTKNQGGSENIDIDLMGNLCEIKSPEAVPNSNAKDQYKFVYRDVQKARHQFERRDGDVVPMRVVLSNYYTGFFDEDEMEVFERFRHEVERQGFAEGLFIKKDGTVLRAR